ncbi:MAG: hypothetical protein WA970_06040 [Gammaproteobacteria bacterium]|jgi:hypothetical protein
MESGLEEFFIEKHDKAPSSRFEDTALLAGTALPGGVRNFDRFTGWQRIDTQE